ncbi:MAG: hypothetical protein KA765_08680 [Thermoflexales bacterium]|nr:hypothetical protein [Thermoflexales bacterium]
MEFDNREYVGRGLDILRDALNPYVQAKLKARYGTDWWSQAVGSVLNKHEKQEISTAGGSPEDWFATLDVPKLRRIILHVWDSVFKDDLGENGRNLISEISGVRNPWAHQHPFEFDDGYEALGQIATLLRLIKADVQQKLIKHLQNELSRSQVKKEPVRRGAKARPGAPRLPHASPKDFVGRTLELNQLQLELRGGQLGVIVYGSGGFGKTTLVTKLAEQIKRRYPDGQIYLDLKGAGIEAALSVKEIAAYIIQTLEPQLSLPEDVPALIASYQRLAFTKRAKDDKEEPREPRRVLLFLDNVANAEQVRDLVPPDNRSIMLLTSRQQFDLRGFNSLSLDALPHDEAVHLLMSIAPSFLNEPEADAIATLLGDYPLALVQAGRYLAEDIDADPDEYIYQLQQLPLQRLGLIERSLRLSYDALKAEEQKAWHEVAIFSGSFDVQAVSAICDLDLESARKHVNSLSRRSLVKHNRKAKRYQLHDLHREFALHQLTANERTEAERRHAFYFLETAITAVREIYLGNEEAENQAAELFEWDWNNYQAAWEWASEHAGADVSVARLCYQYLDVGWSLITQRRPANEWVEWLEKSLADARESGDLRQQSIRLYHLGQATLSIDYYEQTLPLARNFWRKESWPLILTPLGGLLVREMERIPYGSMPLDWDSEDLPASITVSYDRFSLFAGDESDRELNMVKIKVDALRGMEYLKEAADILHESDDDWREVEALAKLSSAYSNFGRSELALMIHEKAFELAEKINHDEVGNLAWTLGYYYLGLGRKALADGRPADAVAVIGKFLGLSRYWDNENDSQSEALQCLALANIQLGRMDDAAKATGEMWSALFERFNRNNIEGDEFVDMAWKVALAFEQFGNFAVAVLHMSECVEIAFGYRLPIVFDQLQRISVSKATNDARYEAVKYCLDQLRSLFDWSTSDEHEAYNAQVHWQLALLLEQTKHLAEAITEMEQCVDNEVDLDLSTAGEHMAYLESLRVQWVSQQRGQ